MRWRDSTNISDYRGTQSQTTPLTIADVTLYFGNNEVNREATVMSSNRQLIVVSPPKQTYPVAGGGKEGHTEECALV